MKEAVVIKKSPVVIIKNLLVVQAVITGFYFLAAVIANYGDIYQATSLPKIISYELAKTLFIATGEAWFIGFIFLRWFFNTETFYPEMFIREWGILWKKRETIAMKRPLDISVHFSPLARIFGYGTLIIIDADKKSLTVFNVPNPENYKKIISEQQKKLLISKTSLKDIEIDKLLQERERSDLEFKSSFRWDHKEDKFNKHLEKAVLKTVAAFLNSTGGYLIVGVNDKGDPVGLEKDYSTITKKDADGFENHFTLAFNSTLGSEFHQFIKMSFPKVNEKEICFIKIFPSDKPVYAKLDNNEYFFVRTGNSTTALPLSQINSYINSRWREN